MGQALLVRRSTGAETEEEINKFLPRQIRKLQSSSDTFKITVFWELPEELSNYAGVLIVRKVGAVPEHVEDGVAFNLQGLGKSYVDSAVEKNTVYYYRAFAYNSLLQYQTDLTGAVTSGSLNQGLLLSSLPTNTLIKDMNTTCYGKPIIWKIADKNHQGYPENSITLVANNIITFKCYDANEPQNMDSARKNGGSNRYIHSNIRQWLNSDAGAGEWFTPQHAVDEPPTTENLFPGQGNSYAMEPGFLHTFSPYFKSALLDTTLTVARNTVTDGGGYDTFTDKMFLGSATEMGIIGSPLKEGIRFPTFTNDITRKGYPTIEAVSNSFMPNKGPDVTLPWEWWFRTPVSSMSSHVYSASRNSGTYSTDAYSSVYGVRPLCNVPGHLRVSLSTDSDRAYVLV